MLLMLLSRSQHLSMDLNGPYEVDLALRVSHWRFRQTRITPFPYGKIRIVILNGIHFTVKTVAEEIRTNTFLGGSAVPKGVIAGQAVIPALEKSVAIPGL